MKEEYYLNNNLNSCIKLPKKVTEYLIKDNYLSEFSTLEEQELVILNLGLIPKFLELKNLIDLKVILSGGVPWDLVPTEGNIDHVLSSNAVYLALTKYYTKIEIDNKIQQLFDYILHNASVVDELLSNNSTNSVLNKVIKNALDLLYLKILEVENHLSEISTEALEEEIARAKEEEGKLSTRLRVLENGPYSFIVDGIKHIIIKKSLYSKLTEYENNALYFVTKDWTFGEEFPIVFSDTTWTFGKQFPINLI